MTEYGTRHPGDDREDPPRPPARGPAAPLWPAPPTGDVAGPVLGAPPPAATAPAPASPLAASLQSSTALPPAAARPAGQPAPAVGTDSTSRLSGARTATADPDTAHQAGGTILMGGAAQTSGAAQAQATATTTAVATQRGTGTASRLATATDQGTIYGGGNGPNGEYNGRGGTRVRPLPALRIGSHLASTVAFDDIRLSALGAGLLLGHDRDRQPVQVRIFRPEPTRTTLVGGLWASRMLAFRALGIGARVVVFTGRPEQWEGFGQWATGRSDRVAVLPAERPITVDAGPRTPALLIYDVGLLGASNRPTLGPWQTQLTVLQQLTAYGFPAIQESNMVMMQRLGSDEAYAAGSVLRLAPRTPQLLGALRDDMVALVGGGADRYVWVNPTDVEQRQFGAAHR